MKIAIPLTDGHLSAHFGHCEQFALIEADPVSKQILNQTLATPPPHEPGVLPRWLQQQGVQMIIAGGMGRRALELFAHNGIAVHAGAPGDTPNIAARAFLNGTLAGGSPVCGHGGGHRHGQGQCHGHGHGHSQAHGHQHECHNEGQPPQGA